MLQMFVVVMSNSIVPLTYLSQHSALVTFFLSLLYPFFGAINSPLGAETGRLNVTGPFSVIVIQFWWVGADDSAPRGSPCFVWERRSGNVEVLWAGPVWKCMAQTALSLNLWACNGDRWKERWTRAVRVSENTHCIDFLVCWFLCQVHFFP